MNRDPRFDRAYLRSELWPAIVRRWPGAAQAIGRAAGHAADAQRLLDRSADLALQYLRDGDGLSIPRLRALPENERINVLRRWLGEAGIAAPPAARLSEGLRQIFTAGADHAPAVEWGAHALRRYRDRLFHTPDHPPVLALEREWPMRAQAHCDLGEGLGTLRWVRRAGGLNEALLPDRLSVRRRRGGETLKPGANAHTQSVQHLCQAMGILPWMRDALPFIYAGEELIAIGDIWQDARWQVGRNEAGYECVWEGAPDRIVGGRAFW